MFIIAVSIFFGSLTAYLARRGGKNPYLWFLIGMLLGCVGLCIFFLIPKPASQQEEAIPTVDVISEPPQEKFWYYLDSENRQFGPMSFQALKKAYQEGVIALETYVWNESLKDWTLFKEFIREDALV